MKLFSVLKRTFELNDIKISERQDTVEAICTINPTMTLTPDLFKSLLSLAPSRDIFTIVLKDPSGDIVQMENQNIEAVDLVNFPLCMSDEDEIEMIICIDKRVSDGRFSIYDFSSFADDLLGCATLDVLKWFSKLLHDQDSIVFDVFDNDISFCTRTMAFESSDDARFYSHIIRKERLNTCKETVNFYDMRTIELIPDDFIIEGITRGNNKLNLLFGKLATLLSIIYVSSTSAINTDIVNLQIVGQKIVNYDFKITEIKNDPKWQKIYSWVYTEGNSIDKALIAHNVLSLYCKYSSLLELEDTVFEAVKTNYNLYLRTNVNQYLDMKRDIAKFIQDVVTQVGDYALSILDKFKTNIIAIFGFLFTVVLTQIGETQKVDDIFTYDINVIIEFSLFGSFIYMIISLSEVVFRFKKTKKGYYNLKDNYSDVLSEEEINDAFKNDTLLENTEKTTKKSAIIWAFVWGLLLVAGVVIIERYTTEGGLITFL